MNTPFGKILEKNIFKKVCYLIKFSCRCGYEQLCSLDPGSQYRGFLHNWHNLYSDGDFSSHAESDHGKVEK